MSFLIGLGIGVVIGWLLPQPPWFTALVAKLKEQPKG